MQQEYPQREATILVAEAEQFEAVSSGVRFEMLTFLIAAGPCSIAVLAEQMDRRADGLYHHIRKLVNAGLIREVGFRKSGRQVETIYDTVADHFQFDVDFASGRNVERIIQLMKATLRRSERIVSDAIAAGVVSFEEGSRNAFIRGDTAWLTSTDLSKVIGHLQSIIDIFDAGRRQRDGELYAVTFSLSPLVRRRAAQPRTNTESTDVSTPKTSPSPRRKKKS